MPIAVPITDKFPESRLLQERGFEFFRASNSDYFKTAFAQTRSINPFHLIIDNDERIRAALDSKYLDNPVLLSAEEANERYGLGGQLKFEDHIFETEAMFLHHRKKQEIARNQVLSRASTGQKAIGLGASLTASFYDPINVAASFFPVVSAGRTFNVAGRTLSTGRFAKLARATEFSVNGVKNPLLKRAAARVGAGSVEGAVGNAFVEPLVLPFAESVQADYDTYDSLMNVAFGAVIGATLQTGARGLGDILEAANLRVETKVNMLRTSLADVLERRRTDTAHDALRLDPGELKRRALEDPEIQERFPEFVRSDADKLSADERFIVKEIRETTEAAAIFDRGSEDFKPDMDLIRSSKKEKTLSGHDLVRRVEDDKSIIIDRRTGSSAEISINPRDPSSPIMEDPHIFIEGIVTPKEARGQGGATRVLEEVIALARKAKVPVLLQLEAINADSLARFYSSFGFRKAFDSDLASGLAPDDVFIFRPSKEFDSRPTQNRRQDFRKTLARKIKDLRRQGEEAIKQKKLKQSDGEPRNPLPDPREDSSIKHESIGQESDIAQEIDATEKQFQEFIQDFGDEVPEDAALALKDLGDEIQTRKKLPKAFQEAMLCVRNNL